MIKRAFLLYLSAVTASMAFASPASNPPIQRNRSQTPRETALRIQRVDTMTFAFVEQFIIVAGYQGEKRELRLWHVRPPKAMRHFPPIAESSLVCAFSPDEKLVATANLNTVSLWEARTRKPVKTLTLANSGTIVRLAFSPDSKNLAASSVLAASNSAGNPPGSVEIWSIDAGRMIHKLPTGAVDMAFMPNGRQIALAGQDVSIWDLQTATKMKTISKLPATKLAVAAKGTALVCGGGKTPGLAVWNAATGVQTAQLDIGKTALSSIDISPNGNWLAAGSTATLPAAGAFQLWNLNGKPTIKQQKPGDVYGVKFSASSTLLAVGGAQSISIVDIKP